VRTAGELSHLPYPIEHGASYAVIRKGLELHPPLRVEPLLCLQEASKAEGDQVFEVASKAQLPPKSTSQSVDHFLVLRDELGAGHANRLLNGRSLAKWVNEVK
jgi:hypothetical protein